MAHVTTFMLSVHFDDWPGARQLCDWLADGNGGEPRLLSERLLAASDRTWSTLSLLYGAGLNHADLDALVRTAESIAWVVPQAVQLLIADEGDPHFQMWMLREGKMRQLTPLAPDNEEVLGDPPAFPFLEEDRLVRASLGDAQPLIRLNDQNTAHWLELGVETRNSRWPMTTNAPGNDYAVLAAFAAIPRPDIHVYAYVCDGPVDVEAASWQWATRGPIEGVWRDHAGRPRGKVTSLYAAICCEHMLVWNDHGGRVYLAAFAKEWDPLFAWWASAGRSVETP